MQSPAVNQQIDFTALKTISPQLNSSQSEAYSAPKKSFEEMILSSQKENSVEKPVDSKNVSQEKTEYSGNPDAENKTAEKVSELQESKEVVSEEKAVSVKDVTEKSENKTDSSVLFENFILEKVSKTSSKEENVPEPVLKNRVTELSGEELTEALKNTKKLASSKEEEDAVCLEDIKNLTENDDAALFAALTASDNILKAQEKSDFSDLSQISENIFELEPLTETEESAHATPKTFAFDKDGKIIVKDFRSEAPEAEKKADEKIDGKTELKVSDVKFDGNHAELTMEVPENVIQNVTSSSDQTASAQGSNFQAMLSNQIQQNASEFVKAGSIVLRDNDVGSIKLILKPENLGNVKVDLQISDKNITGRIVVASQEAFNAFKESADSLRQAFMESGFENASFDLAFAGQDASQNSSDGKQENPAATYNMARAYGDFTDSGDDFVQLEETATFAPRSSVNIVA